MFKNTSPTTSAGSSTVQTDFIKSIEPHTAALYRYCLTLSGNRDDADDLLQNTLIKGYLKREAFLGQGSMIGWLCGIARNEYFDIHRTSSRRRAILDQASRGASGVTRSLPGGGAVPLSPEESAVNAESAAVLLRCLQEIPHDFREVVFLCDVEDMSYADAAEALSIPVGTVKSRHARGRERLRDAYERLNSLAPEIRQKVG